MDINNLLIIPAIISPLSELFPEYGVSYWKPRYKSVKFYNKVIYRRILAVILIWVPITLILFTNNPYITPIAISFIILSIYMREFKYSYSSKLYFIGFSFIFYILYDNCNKHDENDKCINKILLSNIITLTGGYLILMGRKGNLLVDILGRIMFSIGFVLFILNLKTL